MTIKRISHYRLDLYFVDAPILLLLFIIAFVFLVFKFYQQINLRRLLISGIIILLFILGQKIADYYINYSYFDLQNNWHYFAYAVYSFLAYRYNNTRFKNNMIIARNIALSGFFISSFDEFIQVFLSNRIFDVSDIAKDFLGLTIGLWIIFFIFKDYKLNNINFVIRNVKQYFKKTENFIFQLVIFAILFLFFSSNLTEMDYIHLIFIFTFTTQFILIIILKLCSYEYIKYAFATLTILIIGYWIVYSFVPIQDKINIDDDEIIYSNFPLIFFDYMIYTDGCIRVVDKKKTFIGSDFDVFRQQKADILIVTSGDDGSGGKGFQGTKHYEFTYFQDNEYTGRPMQIVILQNSQAFKEYYRLINEGKKVLLVVHNSL